ncbi:hypothetical protein SADUNF_Sadunf13G0030900 [Salix dunnii]|uniref:Uncharacterized protein n=1 Tax=Salix dunnii TaxID=1413687 RepID=A0A835JIL1_9ROSI|nr:hypothetical protein SADUNF_Sadunf13G0030900 [Salix dunnii]
MQLLACHASETFRNEFLAMNSWYGISEPWNQSPCDAVCLLARRRREYYAMSLLITYSFALELLAMSKEYLVVNARSSNLAWPGERNPL